MISEKNKSAAKEKLEKIKNRIVVDGEKFDLQGQLIFGPRDDSVQDWAKEWANCGHGLRYHRNMTRGQLGL